MQYKKYKIQKTDGGWIIRNSKGQYIIKTPTDKEAKEWIDEREKET